MNSTAQYSTSSTSAEQRRALSSHNNHFPDDGIITFLRASHSDLSTVHITLEKKLHASLLSGLVITALGPGGVSADAKVENDVGLAGKSDGN